MSSTSHFAFSFDLMKGVLSTIHEEGIKPPHFLSVFSLFYFLHIIICIDDGGIDVLDFYTTAQNFVIEKTDCSIK